VGGVGGGRSAGGILDRKGERQTRPEVALLEMTACVRHSNVGLLEVSQEARGDGLRVTLRTKIRSPEKTAPGINRNWEGFLHYHPRGSTDLPGEKMAVANLGESQKGQLKISVT